MTDKKPAAKKKTAAKKKWNKVGLSLKALAQWAEDAVLAARTEVPAVKGKRVGEARAQFAVRYLAYRLDEAINPPTALGEALSDGAIYGSRIILAAIIEGAFERLRAQGRA